MDEVELRELITAIQGGELSVDAAVSRLRGGAERRVAEAVHGADEFARIREIAKLFATDSEAVQVGIGDDAAVLRPQAEPLVFSVDVAVESVHFDLAFLSWAQVGARAMTAAVSD
ncbi:MAG TPA: AIR synthase related protein, partial [Polyangiales bacterium]|nr:AIR synthase related protein [Polyangiales bacterium]